MSVGPRSDWPVHEDTRCTGRATPPIWSGICGMAGHQGHRSSAVEQQFRKWEFVSAGGELVSIRSLITAAGAIALAGAFTLVTPARAAADGAYSSGREPTFLGG